MDMPIPMPRLSRRTPLTALVKLTVTALISIPVLFSYLQIVLLDRVEMPLPIFSVVAILLATVVAAYPIGGWRWTPLLGTSWCGLMIGGNLDHLVADLQRPGDTHLFAFVVVLIAIMIVGFLGGIAATVQNYRRYSRTPRGLSTALGILGALAVGMIVTAAIPQAAQGVGISADTLATLPHVSASRFKFDQQEIHARVGETIALRLDNHDAVGHSFDVDELNVHALMPAGEAGLALFKPTEPGTYTFYCAIPGHAEKATKSGMVGTLIVAP